MLKPGPAVLTAGLEGSLCRITGVCCGTAYRSGFPGTAAARSRAVEIHRADDVESRHELEEMFVNVGCSFSIVNMENGRCCIFYVCHLFIAYLLEHTTGRCPGTYTVKA